MPRAEAPEPRRVLPPGGGHGPRQGGQGRVPNQLRPGAVPALIVQSFSLTLYITPNILILRQSKTTGVQR